MKLKNINAKRVVKAFEKIGYKVSRQRGTHVVLKKIENGLEKTLIIPTHHKEIALGTITDILNNQAKISREEFFEYY